MRKALTTWMMLLALFGLTACQGEKATVTGQYGTGVVSGRVVMADGSSPAGVQVSVSGTGLRATLDADGAFAFAGVREGAELVFERAADNVSAKLGTVSGVIELSKDQAKKGTRKGRAAGGKAAQFEGLIRTASATQIVVFTSKGVEQAVAIAAETIIRKGNKPVLAAELLPGTRVHVKAQATEAGYTALLVTVQNSGGDDEDDDGEESPEGKEYEGIVVSSGAAQLVMTDAKGVQQTFVLTATTDIRKGNTPVTAAELLPGTRVHVKAATAADGVKTATRVIVQNVKNSGVKVNGQVTAVSATGLTVQTETSSVTIATDASTRIVKKKAAIALTDIRAGDRVKVDGTPAGENVVLAREIEVK